jgi:hypothetical protein
MIAAYLGVFSISVLMEVLTGDVVPIFCNRFEPRIEKQMFCVSIAVFFGRLLMIPDATLFFSKAQRAPFEQAVLN